MTKENNAAKWVSNHGVKIYSPKSSGYWRVVWTEDGKTKDTTAKNEAEALSKASGIEMRLMTPNGRLSMLSVKDMYKAYVDPNQGGNTREEWGKKHTRNTCQIFNHTILKSIGDVKCADLKETHLRRIKAFEARTPHGIPPEPLMASLSPLEDRDNEFRVRLMDDEQNLEAALALRIGDFQEPSPSDWGLTENAISFLSDLVKKIDFEGDMPQSAEEWYRWWYENTFFEESGDRNEKVFMDFDLPSFNEPTPSDLEIIEQAANAYVELRSNDPESLESFSEEEIGTLQDAVLITRK